MLAIQVSAVSFAQAGDNIPSGKELEYAKQLYMLINQFDNNENVFVEKMKDVPITDNATILKAFKGKFDYTKQFYLTVREQVPTTKFVPVQKTLLEGIYGNLQYLQVVVNELGTGKNLIDINKIHGNKFQAANSVYEKGVKDFMAVIKSWQRPYIKQVTGL